MHIQTDESHRIERGRVHFHCVSRRALPSSLLIFLASLALCSATLAKPEVTVVHRSPSKLNGEVLVVDQGPRRSMRFGSEKGDEQSSIDRARPSELQHEYLRDAAEAVNGNVSAPANVLLIGLGGGAFWHYLRDKYPDARISSVEIDPVVVAIAQKYFGVKEDSKSKLVVKDAVQFVGDYGRFGPAPPRFDLILVDAYGSDDYPRGLGTALFFSRINRLLAPNGMAILNLAVGPTTQALLLKRWENVFPVCRRRDGRTDGNIIVVGSHVRTEYGQKCRWRKGRSR